jgi:hypothetical protein
VDNRLYVLVRGDLTKSQQAVQAGHAIAQFCIFDNRDQWGETQWANEYLIYLKVKDLTELLIWRERIAARKQSWTEFKEPDLNNETTAVVAFGLEVAAMLSDLPLL